MLSDDIKQLIGKVPGGKPSERRNRIHQGWWRAFVLGKAQGKHPIVKSEIICNTICDNELEGHNFLTDDIRKVVQSTIELRAKLKQTMKTEPPGMIQVDRLYNNLLSSQPLCFNFFGELANDLILAKDYLNTFIGDIITVSSIWFEWAPIPIVNYANDHSAFDVAFEVNKLNSKGILGIECKYTDSLSGKIRDKERYRDVFKNSTSFKFKYDRYISNKYNQLFRNQLIAESILQKRTYDFVITGLLCDDNDMSALATAQEFQGMLVEGEDKFKIITFRQFLKAIQQLNISNEQREWASLLWARYCAIQLSQNIYDIYEKS
jgi:hypothetical protein